MGDCALYEQKTILQSYYDLNNLYTISVDNINKIIEYSQWLGGSSTGINMALFQMINLLQLSHVINLKLSKSGKYSFMKIDIVISLIIYYSARGLLDNREENILKRLCDIVDLGEPTENGLKYEVFPYKPKF